MTQRTAPVPLARKILRGSTEQIRRAGNCLKKLPDGKVPAEWWEHYHRVLSSLTDLGKKLEPIEGRKYDIELNREAALS
jgi:hypothetical protein